MLINKIYFGDCLKIMKDFPKNKLDLIFADPPYNLSKGNLNLINNKTGGAFYKMKEDWDNIDSDYYMDFTNKWIKLCSSLLKQTGSLYISCSHHNISEVILNSKKSGLKLNNIITWFKTNSMPNITKRTFTHSTEFVCWFVKGKNWVFNYEVLKKINPNKTLEGKNKQMRDFLDFIELPILQGKERIKSIDNRAAHPNQKPERLIELIINASTKEGDWILDPFLGTGTTYVVARKLKRNCIGIENNMKYYNISLERINKTE